MRRFATLAMLALVLPLAPAGSAQSLPAVSIAEILPVPAAGQREFLELWNRADAPVDLAGWSVSDAAGNAYVFAATPVPAGGRLVLWVGGAGDAHGPAWGRSSVWNDGGDTAFLRDAAGALVDSFAYGTAERPTPPQGVALALVDGNWTEAAPTPGLPPGAEGGAVTATVNDVPPRVAFEGAPLHARVGATLAIAFRVTEENGDAVAWNLTAGGATVAAGTQAGLRRANVTAPAEPGPWVLRLAATDAQGNAAAATWTIEVRLGDLAVTVPAGGVAFPAFDPGASNVTAGPFRVENLADRTLAPRFDVSPLRLGAAQIPVDGNLRVGVRPAGSATPYAWVDYGGPLTRLPDLPAGAAWDVALQIVQVPTPLPAGAYGTSFTVVP